MNAYRPLKHVLVNCDIFQSDGPIWKPGISSDC